MSCIRIVFYISITRETFLKTNIYFPINLHMQIYAHPYLYDFSFLYLHMQIYVLLSVSCIRHTWHLIYEPWSENLKKKNCLLFSSIFNPQEGKTASRV